MRSRVVRSSVLAFLLCSSCGARYVRIAEKGLTCVQAHQIAMAAARRMGYTIDDATKPTPNVPGLIVASRTEGTSKHAMLVHVVCTVLGAEVEAKSDQDGLGQLTFPSEFKRNFETVAAARPPVRAAPESGLDVLVMPERREAADLGVDLSEAGILAVRVRITNRTPRGYHFRVSDVVLQTADGERVLPLRITDVPQIGPAAADTLRQKLLTDRDVMPDEALAGFLLFPFKSYARARVVLTDRVSEEPEGVSIEF
jgi:hypothetical protein